MGWSLVDKEGTTLQGPGPESPVSETLQRGGARVREGWFEQSWHGLLEVGWGWVRKGRSRGSSGAANYSGQCGKGSRRNVVGPMGEVWKGAGLTVPLGAW